MQMVALTAVLLECPMDVWKEQTMDCSDATLVVKLVELAAMLIGSLVL